VQFLAAGIALGWIATRLFARIPDSIGAFAPVLSVAAAALSFGIADELKGSGFLAVYLVGLAVGSTPSRYRRQPHSTKGSPSWHRWGSS